MRKSQKIFLVGMPGSGKSTIGSEIAELLGYNFFDLDTEIENSTHRTITDIFSNEGEEGFRLIEKDLLKDLVNNSEKFVLATGGGAPCFYDNMVRMKRAGITVFLKPPINTLIERLRNDHSRPLFSKIPVQEIGDKIAEMYKSRFPFYNQANIMTESCLPEEIVKSIMIEDQANG